MTKFKTFTVLFGALLLASMTSCTKDGIYTPSKKIRKVYESSTYTPKHLSQAWHWDDNLLATVEHYTIIGDVGWTERYTYDGKRLIRVDNNNPTEYTLYNYDGNRLKSVDYYYHDILDATAAYEYSGTKISQATITYYHGYKKGDECGLMSYLPFPDEIAEAAEKCLAKVVDNEQKSIRVMNLQFAWDGDNVSKIIVVIDDETSIVTMQYDNKNNPLKGFMSLLSWELDEVDDGDMYYSKNNVTSMFFVFSDGDTEDMTFTYQYDSDNYPTMRTLSDYFQYVTYYEYQ